MAALRGKGLISTGYKTLTVLDVLELHRYVQPSWTPEWNVYTDASRVRSAVTSHEPARDALAENLDVVREAVATYDQAVATYDYPLDQILTGQSIRRSGSTGGFGGRLDGKRSGG